MAGTLIDDGPHDYWATDKPPSPGQWQAIAAAACKLLGLPEPATRLEASTILVRLRLGGAELEPVAHDFDQP